jgi:CHAT domain-containing protein/predicted negative regulator of RcsB-dependent stress response
LKQNDNRSALSFYRKALTCESERKNADNLLIASLYLNIAIGYSNLDFYDSATFFFDKSILLKERYLDNNDPQRASGYLNYGRFLQIIGESIKALDYLGKAENIYIANFGVDYAGLAPLYYNKGSIYLTQCDYNQALSYHERALGLYEKNKAAAITVVNEMYLNFGLIYEKLDNPQKAIEYYEKCQSENSSIESRIKSLRNSARCYYDLGNFNQAERNYQKSIVLSEQQFGKSSIISAGSYRAYGLFCIQTNKYEKGVDLLNSSLHFYLESFGNKNSEVSLVFAHLGDLYLNKGEVEKALAYYQEALISAIQNFENKDVYSNPLIQDIEPKFNNFIILYKKSVALFNKYIKNNLNLNHLQAGYETNKLAIALFEKILSSYKDENTKLLINETVYDIYNSNVLMAAELNEKTSKPEYLQSAFEYSEKGKSAVLLSTLRRSDAIITGRIPDSIKKLEQNLSQELALYKNNLFDENQKIVFDSNKIFNLKKVIFEKTFKYDSLINELEKKFPDYFQLKYSFNVSSISDVRKSLESSDAFLEYKIIDSVLITFYLTCDTMILSKQVITGNLTDSISQFLKFINTFPVNNLNKESYTTFILKGYYFYDLLLAKIDGLNKHKNLLIVPDGILGYLNFETLVMDNRVPKNIDFKNLPYVLKQYSITFINSATIMQRKKMLKLNNRQLLAIAPIYQNIDNLILPQKQLTRDKLNMLRPLDYSQQEVSDIMSSIHGMKLIDEMATERNFKIKAADYSIIHFAMHTLIDDEDPLKSKMIFTLNNDSAEDGFLNNYEIYNLNLNADLAVLSACKTGLGKYNRGEGVMSLARGFMYAGVPTIIMTLWEIEDVSSAIIMNYFYKRLKEKVKVSDALRDAKITYLNNSDVVRSHPYFWAAYVQIGDNSPIITRSTNNYIVYPIVLLFLIIAIIVGRVRYKQRKSIN